MGTFRTWALTGEMQLCIKVRGRCEWPSATVHGCCMCAAAGVRARTASGAAYTVGVARVSAVPRVCTEQQPVLCWSGSLQLIW